MTARSRRTARRSAGTSVAAFVGLMVTGAPALAADGWLIRGAVEAGGDKFGEVEFTGGRSESIKAGDGFNIEGGYRSGFVGPAFQSDLTVGYKSDSANASNGEFSFSRITLNAMQYFLIGERFRIGAGATYHLGPELEIDVPVGFGGRINETLEADDAFGFVLAADYVVNAHVEIGARATFVDYEFDEGDEVDGNSVGAYLTYRFGDD